jgi:hypothetical protein
MFDDDIFLFEDAHRELKWFAPHPLQASSEATADSSLAGMELCATVIGSNEATRRIIATKWHAENAIVIEGA